MLMPMMSGMVGWMDGWIIVWMDGWINGWLCGWMDRWMMMDGRAFKDSYEPKLQASQLISTLYFVYHTLTNSLMRHQHQHFDQSQFSCTSHIIEFLFLGAEEIILICFWHLLAWVTAAASVFEFRRSHMSRLNFSSMLVVKLNGACWQG